MRTIIGKSRKARSSKPKQIDVRHAYSDGFYDGRDGKPSREALCTERAKPNYLRAYEAGRDHKG